MALGKGDGTFQNASTIPYTTSFPDPAIVVRADFNEDGVSDLAAIGKPTTKHPGYGTLLTQSAAAVDVSGIAPQGSGTHQVVARYWSGNDFISSVSKPIELSGLTAAAPVASFSMLAVPFDETPVGETSNAKTVVLTNTGTAALVIDGLALSPSSGPGFSFASSNNCPGSLATGASCKIRFRFVPGSFGAKRANLLLPTTLGTLHR